MAHAAAVIVLRDLPALVPAIFNASQATAMEPEPVPGMQPLGGSTGQPRDPLGLTAGGKPPHSGPRCGRRETDRLRSGRAGAEHPNFIPAAVAFLGAGAGAG
jgi:hypothetical protein